MLIFHGSLFALNLFLMFLSLKNLDFLAFAFTSLALLISGTQFIIEALGRKE